MGLPLALGLVLASGVVAFGVYRFKQADNTLVVTGSAKELVKSDSVKWIGVVTRSGEMSKLNEGYVNLEADTNRVIAFLKEAKYTDKDFVVEPVSLEQTSIYNQGFPSQFVLRRNIRLISSDVEGVTKLANNLNKLVQQGVVISTQQLEYTYTKLPDLRLKLLSEAVKDARKRAETIAESGDQTLGSLRSASMGVVQVLSPNSMEISDYGAYDTSQVEKEVMITVKTTFGIK